MRHQIMIIKTQNGQEFDTDKDLTAPERHVLQKMFAWELMADDLGLFREKKETALKNGWNNSGPIIAGNALKIIIKNMEKNVSLRLNKKS